jgi:hypothetical protein
VEPTVAATAGIVAPLGHRLAGLLLAASGLIAPAGRIRAVRRLAPVAWAPASSAPHPGPDAAGSPAGGRHDRGHGPADVIDPVRQGELVQALVIGAGIGGLALAGRLCQQGRPPVIVERAASAEFGYAIGSYPVLALHAAVTVPAAQAAAHDGGVRDPAGVPRGCCAGRGRRRP